MSTLLVETATISGTTTIDGCTYTDIPTTPINDDKNNDNNNNDNHNHNNIIITIDDAIDKLGYGHFQRRMLFAVGLCMASDAMEILLLTFLSIAIQVEWTDLTQTQSSTLISSVFAGAFCGTIVLGRLGDVQGRKVTFLVTATIVAIFGVLSCICQTFHQLLWTRFFVGIGIGGMTVPFDTYSEFLPSGSRGTLLSLPSYFWTSGTIMVAILAKLCLDESTSTSSTSTPRWRLLCFYCSIPCILSVILGIMVIPESPRWLLTQQQQPQKQQGEEEEKHQNGKLSTLSSSSSYNHNNTDIQILNILRHAAKMNGKNPLIVFPPGTKIISATTISTTTITTNENDNHHYHDNDNDYDYDYDNNDENIINNVFDGSNNKNKNDNGISSLPSSSSSSNAWKLLSPKWYKTFLLICTLWFGHSSLYFGTILIITRIFSTITTTTTSSSSSTSSNKDLHSLLVPTIYNNTNDTVMDDYYGNYDNNYNNDNDNDTNDNHVFSFQFDYSAIIISTLAELTGATIIIFVVDRYGRRNIHSLSFLLGGMIVMILCFVSSSSSSSSSLSSFIFNNDNNNNKVVLILLAFLSRMSIFCGSSVTWIWTAELFSTELRTTGHAIASASGRIGGLIIPYVISYSISLSSSLSKYSSNDNHKDNEESIMITGMIMAIICLIIVSCGRCLPDTHGVPMGSAVLQQPQRQERQEYRRYKYSNKKDNYGSSGYDDDNYNDNDDNNNDGEVEVEVLGSHGLFSSYQKNKNIARMHDE